MNLSDLDVNPRIISALKKAKINDFVSILSRSSTDLERSCQLSSNDIITLKSAVSNIVLKKNDSITALDLYNGTCGSIPPHQKLSTGCDLLDKFLRGGILSRGITEIAGPSATGKTQICLQLCLTVQLPVEKGGLDAGAVYICTEDAFPNKRLQQMMLHFKKKVIPTNGPARKLGDHIFIEHIAEKEDLMFCVKNRLPVLLSRGTVKLVIVDSIAALFRSDFQVHETFKRSKLLSSLSAQLRKLSDTFNIPVVCVNQVSAVMKKPSHASQLPEEQVTPSLGLVWSNLVTTRLMLSRTPHTVTLEHRDNAGNVVNSIDAAVRTIQVKFAPHLPNRSHHYIIDAEGVKGIC